MKMKNLMGITLSTAIALSLAACGSSTGNASADRRDSPAIQTAAAISLSTTSTSETVPEAPGVTVQINGQETEIKAHIMVPLQAVAEKLGFTVAVDDDKVVVTGETRYAKMAIGVDQYFAAPTQEGMMGASLFSLGCAPYEADGVTYVPIGLFDALLGCREGTVVLEDNTVKINTEAQNDVQIPNPFVDYETLEDAAAAAGFELTAPDTLDSYPQRTVQTMGKDMIQIFYENDEHSVLVRKAAGDSDISGDYNVYSQNGTMDVDGLTVSVRGNDGLIMVAIWSNGGYTYAVDSDAGMSAENMSELIQNVK